MVASSFDWGMVLDIGVGVGVLLVGIGVLLGMLALAKTLQRVNVTLDEVDRQLVALGKPVTATLEHLDGIVETTDRTLTSLGGAVGARERAAGSLSKTADLAKGALAPAIVNVGATLGGITAGLRRLIAGKSSDDPS